MQQDIRALCWERYAAAIRSGTFSPYDCARFIEQPYLYKGDDYAEILKTALLAVARHDPFFFATNPHGDPEINPSVEELKKVVEGWSLTDKGLAAFLEGHLIMSFVFRSETKRELVEHALSALERARSEFGEDLAFLTLYAKALEILGDERYAAVIDATILKTRPEWRSGPLQDAIEHAVDKGDWDRFDLLRTQWDALPRNSHICECAINVIANIDGIRALQLGDQAAAIRFLKAAVSVNGCPHLNSFGVSFRLAKELLSRGLALSELEEHLIAGEKYCISDETKEFRTLLMSRKEELRGTS